MEPQQPQSFQPPMQQQAQQPVQQPKSSIGSIIGTIIIIAVIILGGLYFWGKRIEESKATQSLVNETSQEEAEEMEAAAIKSVTTADDLSSIEADLASTNFDDMNPELE